MAKPRRRNSRGQGANLREEIIAAATKLLAEDSPVSLRAVAKQARIAAPSIYLHFADLDALFLAVLERLFAEHIALRDAAETGTPWQRLLARSIAGVRFGIDHPGHYRVMFEGRVVPKLASPRSADFGRPLLARSVELIQQIPSKKRVTHDPVRLALLLWSGLHGVVSLRINKPTIDWPDPEVLAEQITRAVIQPITSATG
jgi:AcrR family transcriptional regulator